MNASYLYLHVPFCARRCPYCDFAVHATRRPPVAEWVDAIDTELRLRLGGTGSRKLALETIYVGGGTPSLLGADGMDALAAVLAKHAAWDAASIEWTVEANPESFTSEIARGWKTAGVNRVSLGIQTFSDTALRWMGRLHGAGGAFAAYDAAREAGIDNVSLDLIFGLPERLGRDWTADLERVLALRPEHISLYGLTAEPGAALGRWVREGRERMPGDELYGREFLEAAERLGTAGYHHYEVSNFAVPGRESRHNSAYWTGAAYLGLGPSAHSYSRPVRSWNVRGWEPYRNALAAGRIPTEEEETVQPEAERLERYWLALRTDAGLTLPSPSGPLVAVIERWTAEALAIREEDTIRLTRDGWLLLDELTVELDKAADAAVSAMPG